MPHLRFDPLEDRCVPAFPLAVADSFDVPPQRITSFDVLANDPFRDQVTIEAFTTPPSDAGQLLRDGNNFRFFANANISETTFTYTTVARTPETILTPSDVQANGSAGNRVAISRDGNSFAIASRAATVNGIAQVGSVSVFTRSGAGWALLQTLTPSPVNAGTLFGDSLAFDETGTTLIVGAARSDFGGLTDAGEVYVFRRDGDQFIARQVLQAASPQNQALFGLFVSLSANGDTLVIGEGGANGNAGRVGVYTLDQDMFQARTLITPNDATTGDLFGTVALSADGQTLIVGAPGADTAIGTDVGKAYLFTRTGDTFSQRTILNPSQPTSQMRFGDGLISISADGTTFAIASRSPQRVYIYNRSGIIASEVQRVEVPFSGDARFGLFTALTGNGNTLYVGQVGANGDATTRAGRILRYERENGNFVERETITASDTTSELFFGGNVGVTPDGGTLVTGAVGATVNGATNAGKAYVLERGRSTATVTLRRGGVDGSIPASTVGQRTLIATGSPDGRSRVFSYGVAGTPPADADNFQPFNSGVAQSTTGDVDGDGVADLIYGQGPGGSLIRIISGSTGQDLITPFATFEAGFTGGIFVSAFDIDGDGKVDIAVSPDQGGGGRVQIFGYRDGQLEQLDNFFGIDDLTFRGGARVALGDIDGDGRADLLVGAGFGGGPRIAIFDGRDLLMRLSTPRKLVEDFFAFPGPDALTLRDGVFVALGDLDQDGMADLIFGGGPGGGPRVYVLRASGVLVNRASEQLNPLANFFVNGDTTSRGGIRVAAKDVNEDQFLDLVVGSGQQQPASIKSYLGRDLGGEGEPTTFSTMDVFENAVLANGVYLG